MTLEFELPLFSLVFILLLNIVFFSKKKLNLVENKLYEIILISSLIFSIADTILHFNGAMNDYETLITHYFTFANILNKITTLLFILIISSLFCYILLISYVNLKKKIKEIITGLILFNVLCFIVLLFTNIEIIRVGSVTNIIGSTPTFGYTIVAILLLASIIVAFINKRKFDKRYIALFLIIPILISFYILTIIFPGIIIYDLVLALLCYIMFFTIENPDVIMIEKLEIARRRAERANRAKSDFLSSMSHEIRTPLNAIVGFSEDIKTHAHEVPDVVNEDANYIVEASNTLLEIVGNILDINKIESKKMEIVSVPYNFKDTIHDLAKINSVRIGDKPIDFKVDIAEDIPYGLIGDKVHVKQVVNNLLSNAIKYTEEGSVEFAVKCINKEDICNLIISVKDTGRGIKSEDIEKLFNKFERLDVEKNSTTEGTGLGLAITKKLVEMMGGKINVQSNYGEGSLFVVNLPQKIDLDAKEETNNINQVNNLVSYEGKKILIVDDNKLNIKVAKRALESFNLDIDSCESGQECLDKVGIGIHYDLILMDIMMPNMSGETTLKKLKEMSGFNTPVIALTADAVLGAKEKYLSEGFVDYIAKPFSRDQIKEKLDIVFSSNSIPVVEEVVDRFKDVPMHVFGKED